MSTLVTRRREHEQCERIHILYGYIGASVVWGDVSRVLSAREEFRIVYVNVTPLTKIIQ